LIGSELIDIPTDFKESMDIILDELSMGHYTVSFDIQNVYHKGLIFEFTSHITNRSINVDDSRDVTLIKVPEQDAYSFVDKDITQLTDTIQNDQFDFPKSKLLSNMLGRSSKIIDDIVETEQDVVDTVPLPDSVDNTSKSTEYQSDNDQTLQQNKVEEKENLENIRLLLGQGTTTNKHFYWE